MNKGKEIGQRIRNIRKLRNISQTELANKLGLKKNGQISISYLETGKYRKVPFERIEKIASILGTSANYLIRGESYAVNETAYIGISSCFINLLNLNFDKLDKIGFSESINNALLNRDIEVLSYSELAQAINFLTVKPKRNDLN